MKTFIFYFSRECPRPPLPRDDPRGGSSACTFQIFKIHFFVIQKSDSNVDLDRLLDRLLAGAAGRSLVF